MSRRKTILSTLAVVSVLCGCCIYFLYLKNVSIYELVAIKIDGLCVKDCRQVEVFGISPLNKKCRIPYSDTMNEWYYYYAYHKDIGIIIPDSVYRKMNQIDIRIGEAKKMITARSLKCVDSSDAGREFRFPAQIYPGKSIIKMTISVLHWTIVQKTIMLMSILIVVGLLIIYLNKILKVCNLLFKTGLLRIKQALSFLKTRLYTFIRKCRTLIHHPGIVMFRILNKEGKLTCHLENTISGTIPHISKFIFSFFIRILKYLHAHICVYSFFYLALAFLSTVIILILYKFDMEYKVMGYYLIICLFTLIYFVSSFILQFLKKAPQKADNIKLMTIFIMFSFLLSELLLRTGGVKDTQTEKSFGGRYVSSYKVTDEGWYHVHKKKITFNDRRIEFTYQRTTNSLGLCDTETPLIKAPGEYRIIGIGDSYTEGIGVHSDSTWLKFLERNLKSQSLKNLTFINAGVSGSDPFFEYILLKNKLLVYKPDLVILNINHSDIDDIIIRGGLERFRKDGSVKFKNPPAWEWLYSYSYLFRIVLHNLLWYNYNLLSYRENIVQTDIAGKQIISILIKFQELANQNNFRFLVIIQPGRNWIRNKENHNFKKIIDGCLKNGIDCFDMLNYFINRCKVSDKNINEYYWPVDGHYKAKGCSIYARGVEWKLKQMGVIDTVGN